MTFWDQYQIQSIAPITDQLAIFEFFQILAIRFKGAYILEPPIYMDWLWFFLKPFMSSKISSRVHLLGDNYSSLSTLVGDISILPKEFGGSFDSKGNNAYNWIALRIK
jgi:hypothetical protein